MTGEQTSTNWFRFQGLLAQLVEHIVHIDGVTGSSPVQTTMNTDISWYRKTHRLRWVFCYTCKNAHETMIFLSFPQEYTNRLAREIFAL